MGCDVSTITKHYNGTRNLTTDFIVMYARYFNVSADWLLGLSEVRTVSPDTAMICRVTGLDDKAVQTLSAINDPTNFESPKEIIGTLNYILGELDYREQEDGYSWRSSERSTTYSASWTIGSRRTVTPATVSRYCCGWRST